MYGRMRKYADEGSVCAWMWRTLGCCCSICAYDGAMFNAPLFSKTMGIATHRSPEGPSVLEGVGHKSSCPAPHEPPAPPEVHVLLREGFPLVRSCPRQGSVNLEKPLFQCEVVGTSRH